MTINISQIEESLIPQKATLCKKGMKTKEIFLKKSDLEGFSSGLNYIFAKNSKQEISFLSESPIRVANLYVSLKENGEVIKKEFVANYLNGIDTAYNFTIKTNYPIEILYDVPKYIYCIPELPPPEIIAVDKAPTTTSLNDITNYVNKTTESIKSCKSYIAYVINNKGGSATDTETLESLINKLKDIKF